MSGGTPPHVSVCVCVDSERLLCTTLFTIREREANGYRLAGGSNVRINIRQLMGLPWESYPVCTHEHICLKREALSISGAVVSPSLFLCVVHTYYAGPGPSSAILCRRTCDCTTGRPDSNKVFCPETIRTVTFFSSLLFYTPWKQ